MTLIAAPLSEAVTVPGTGGALTATGSVRVRGVVPSHTSPGQDPGVLGELTLDASVLRRLRARLTLDGIAGGPYVDPSPGVFDFWHMFQNRSPALDVREAWAELRLDHAEVTAGVQRFAWGQLDGIPPTDVLNPRGFHDPLVDDLEKAKIGVPALQGTYYLADRPSLDLSDLRLTAVWTPMAVPSRLPLPAERWFPGGAQPVSQIVLSRRGTERLIEEALGQDVTLAGPVRIPVGFTVRNNRPALRFENGGIGLRAGGRWRGLDWNLYHYSGPETAPNGRLLATLLLEDLDVDPATGVLDLRLRSRTVLEQATSTIHMTGADGAFVWGDTAWRAEVAFFQDRPYPRVASELATPEALTRLPGRRIIERLVRQGRTPVPLEPLFVKRDTIEWGVGADTLVHGVLLLGQVNQVAFLESSPGLLLGDPDTRFLVSARRAWWGNRVDAEVRGVYALEQGAWFLQTRVAWAIRDDLRVRAGYLVVGGRRNTIIGEFKDNDEFVFELEWKF